MTPARTAARHRRAGSGSEQALLVALVWATSRVLLVVVLLAVLLDGRHLGEALRGWDAAVYIRLAEHGYTQPNDVAFFPGLPLVLRLMAAFGVDPALAGAMLAVVCSGLAAWALYRIGCRGWGFGRHHQPVTGAVAACLWLLAPTTVFTAVAYTEAPFCAAAFWAWDRARDKQWGQAAVLAGLACTLRVSGLFLVVALLVLALLGNGDGDIAHSDWGSRVRDGAWMLIPVAVLGAYVVYLHETTGSWRAWFDAQEQGWNREFTHPWTALRHTWQAADPDRWPGRQLVGPVFGLEIVSMGAGVVTTLACLVRRRWAEAVWVGSQVAALGTSYWYMSVNRAVLLWFPLFLAIAALLGGPLQGRAAGRVGERTRVSVVLGAVAAISTLLAAGWAWLFFMGQWAS